MNVSFFQTYGDRLPLLKVRAEDSLFQQFVNCFDLNIISLHGCTDNIKQYIHGNSLFNNAVIFDFDNINYCQCIKNLMEYLKDKNVEKFFFYQDDTFSREVSTSNIEDLKKMILGLDYEMINISYKTEHLIEKNHWTPQHKNVIYSTPHFKLFDTTTEDFKTSTLWAFDDSCFICTYKMLQSIFNETYFTFSDIWQAECHLNGRFNQETMPRYITDVSFFINYNILGRNTQSENLSQLARTVMLSDDTLKMLSNYHSRGI
jgi:hypothetical protein